VLATLVVLATGAGGEGVISAVTCLGEMLFAATAAASLGLHARRSSGRDRLSWAALAAGCGAWALGEGVWSWYELVRGDELPFPSVGDVGFLLFPVGASVALWLLPARLSPAERSRGLLDSVTVTAALGLVSWATVLGAVVRAGAADPWALTVSLAYPATDLVVLALLVTVLSRSVRQRVTLVLVGLGVAAIALADSVFAYQTATGSYTGATADLGWVLGFGLLTAAPLVSSTRGGREATQRVRPSAPSALPYLPMLAAALVVLVEMGRGGRPDQVEFGLYALTVALVLLRQHTVVKENAMLVTALSQHEAELQHQAFHDGLTGLANRALFHNRLVHALDLHRRDRRGLAVLFCDLDDFKVVNDSLGHRTGDELLVRVSERLRGALRAGDTLARMGGDEFAVLLEDGGNPLVVAKQVVAVMQSPYALGNSRVQVQVSLGLAVVDRADPTPTADTLLGQADTAMYAAKRAGKGCFRVFEPGMELEEVSDDALRRRLAAAIAERRITLAYQPITELTTGRLLGFEALARWQEHGSRVPPDVFVPAAERTGLIGPLTELILDQACGQLAEWDACGARTDFTVAVNVSPQQIVDLSFPDLVVAALDRHHVRPHRLVLEITESGLLTDLDAAREVTTRLNDLGLMLSLDDFGTGYSSLTHLSNIPLQSLKIDRAFIDSLGVDDKQERFIEALLHFSAHLGLDVIAEGVEVAEQLDLLRAMGCMSGQGYLLGRPAPASEWSASVRQEAPPAVPRQRTERGPARVP
jgi:diguanylate cyclase (GGDEF)-like protein